MVTRYANEIVTLEPLKEDIDDILSSHLLSMQALRDKQTREKEQIRQSLANKRQRLLKRAECDQTKVMEGQGHDGSRNHANQHGTTKVVLFKGEQRSGLNRPKMANKHIEGQGHTVDGRGHAGVGITESLYPRLDMYEGEQRGCNVSRVSVRDDGSDDSNEWKQKNTGHTGIEVWMNGVTSLEDDTAPVTSHDTGPSQVNSSVEAEDWAVKHPHFIERCYSTDNNDIKVRMLDDDIMNVRNNNLRYVMILTHH